MEFFLFLLGSSLVFWFCLGFFVCFFVHFVVFWLGEDNSFPVLPLCSVAVIVVWWLVGF